LETRIAWRIFEKEFLLKKPNTLTPGKAIRVLQQTTKQSIIMNWRFWKMLLIIKMI